MDLDEDIDIQLLAQGTRDEFTRKVEVIRGFDDALSTMGQNLHCMGAMLKAREDLIKARDDTKRDGIERYKMRQKSLQDVSLNDATSGSEEEHQDNLAESADG